MGVRRLFFFARRYDEANLIKMSSESSSGPHDLPRLRRPRILIMAFGGRMNLRLQYRPARVWRRARGLSTLSEGGWRRSRIPIFESSTCTTGLCLVRRSQADLGLSLSALSIHFDLSTGIYGGPLSLIARGELAVDLRGQSSRFSESNFKLRIASPRVWE